MANSELLFVPLGGVGEIGMNLALYGYGPPEDRSWIMVDCGVTFPDSAHPGVDLVMADIEFAMQLGAALKGIVITHKTIPGANHFFTEHLDELIEECGTYLDKRLGLIEGGIEETMLLR